MAIKVVPCAQGDVPQGSGRKKQDATQEVLKNIRVFGFNMQEETRVKQGERLAYKIENFVSSDPNAYFYILLFLTCLVILVLGGLWTLCEINHENLSFPLSLFFSFQIIASKAYAGGITGPAAVILFILMLFCSLIIFGILIGMITDKFQAVVNGMNEGTTKVAESGHTLILGWNETTVRLICQIALLQHGWKAQNKTWSRTLFCWTRVQASTPVAMAPIVIITNQKTKAEMQEAVERAFAIRGISQRDTRIGRDVVCRNGDPTSTLDLQRVGAHRAKAILVMMTDADAQAQEGDASSAKTNTTLRAVLALRVVLFGAPTPPPWEELRVVVQLANASRSLDAISFGNASDGRPILCVQDLSLFLNGVMFQCCAHPGLAFALLDILGFEGSAIRLQRAELFQQGGRHIIGKTVREAALVWEDAVLVGVVSARYWADAGERKANEEGLAPQGDRVIQADDRVIYISESAMPRLAASHPPAIDGAVATRHQSARSSVAVLVCGWRTSWDDPEHFCRRVRETAHSLPAGSSITFLCSQDAADWAALMTEASAFEGAIQEGEESKQWFFERRVALLHVSGNAADYATLSRVVKHAQYDQAIIMATVASETLSPHSKDARVLSIMLLLRHLQAKYRQEPMHVIGENALDSTAVLAMVPCGEELMDVPDFVNVHGIYARALVQSLAFPRMQANVAQLFSSAPSTPNILMADAMHYVPNGQHTFGSLVRHLKERLPDDILVGMRNASGEASLAPRLSAICSCGSGDKLILLTRRPANQE